MSKKQRREQFQNDDNITLDGHSAHLERKPPQTPIALHSARPAPHYKIIFADIPVLIQSEDAMQKLFCLTDDLMANAKFREQMTAHDVSFDKLIKHLISQSSELEANQLHFYFECVHHR